MVPAKMQEATTVRREDINRLRKKLKERLNPPDVNTKNIKEIQKHA
jgi:hypothetical protein